MERVRQVHVSYMNSVSSQVDPFDGDWRCRECRLCRCHNPSRKYEDRQLMEAPAPELTIMRYSDDGIDHQLGVVYSEAHP